MVGRSIDIFAYTKPSVPGNFGGPTGPKNGRIGLEA